MYDLVNTAAQDDQLLKNHPNRDSTSAILHNQVEASPPREHNLENEHNINTHPCNTVNISRNQSVEVGKFIAAIFVILIHVPFPGTVGAIAVCLARFSVPFIFAISGYFSYHISVSTLQKRITKIAKLNLYASLFYFAINISLGFYSGYSVLELQSSSSILPKLPEIVKWLILQVNPFAGHLWYLSAIFVCYVVFWIYIKITAFFTPNYVPLYYCGFTLLMIFIALNWIFPINGVHFAKNTYRNAWLMGLPMFFCGLFVCDYQQRITEVFHVTIGRLSIIISCGVLLSLGELYAGISAELPLGILAIVPVLLLLVVLYPNIKPNSNIFQKVICVFYGLSTSMYVIHLAVLEIYNYFFLQKIQLAYPALASWLKPVIIILITLLISLLWKYTNSSVKRYCIKH